jgi:hypothetical protein
MYEGKTNAHRNFVGKPERKTPLGGPRRGWDDNTMMDRREIGWVVWTELIWLRIGTSGGLI